MNSAKIIATQIRLHKDKKTLSVSFNDGFTAQLSAELLRVESPSAEVQGHSPDQAVLQTGKENIGIVNIEAVGNYAIKIIFSDEHDTGIFSWAYLYHLAENYERGEIRTTH